MARIGTKLCQNAFQTIPDVSFFDAEFFVAKFFRNFERPFTPRTWPVQPPNFAKTRFRRFPTFHFSTSEKQKKQLIFSIEKSKFRFVWRRKMKRWESSEKRFGKVSRQSEPSSRGKRPFEVSTKNSKPPVSNRPNLRNC